VSEETERGFVSLEIVAIVAFLCALIILLALVVPGFDL
jgi:hypothetical protein